MKTNWTTVTLGELCDMKYGKMPKKDDVVEDGYSIFSGYKVVGYHKEFMYERPEIIVVARGVGGTGDIKMSPPFCFLTNLSIALKIKDNRVLKRFLYYKLYGPTLRDLRTGTAQPQIIIADLKVYEVDIPPLPSQHKIAAVLSAYDDLIENNTRRIQILEEMAQRLYREWFVHFRFPGHENITMVESELGMLPEGWKVKKLSELVDTQYGYTESAKEDEIGPKFVRGKDINKTSYIQWDSVPYCPIDEAGFQKYKLAVGDIVVIRMADPGKVGIIEKQIDAVFASYLIRLTIKSNHLSPYYLFSFLNSDRYQNYVTGASTGTTRKSASAGVITDISLTLPPHDVREKFEIQISDIRALLNIILDQNNNLRQTRGLLLPKLISGKIDVSDLDIDIGADAHDP